MSLSTCHAMLPQLTERRRAVGCVILVTVITHLACLKLQVSHITCSAVEGVGTGGVCVSFCLFSLPSFDYLDKKKLNTLSKRYFFMQTVTFKANIEPNNFSMIAEV